MIPLYHLNNTNVSFTMVSFTIIIIAKCREFQVEPDMREPGRAIITNYLHSF